MLNLIKELHKDMWVIFDLDGTLADIESRRKLSTKENGKIDWDKFFDPNNISLDKPFLKIITVATMFKKNDRWLDEITLDTVKELVTQTPNISPKPKIQ